MNTNPPTDNSRRASGQERAARGLQEIIEKISYYSIIYYGIILYHLCSLVKKLSDLEITGNLLNRKLYRVDYLEKYLNLYKQILRSYIHLSQ